MTDTKQDELKLRAWCENCDKVQPADFRANDDVCEDLQCAECDFVIATLWHRRSGAPSTAQVFAQVREIREAEIDSYLDAVLRASGSALKHYTLPKTIDDMRKAMLGALLAAARSQT